MERSEHADGHQSAVDRATIDARITPEGRRCGDGIALAYELMQRGIAVTLDPLDEWTARSRKYELDWADQGGGLDLPDDLPLPAWQEGW
jgi:hypothetical protein